MNNTVTEKNLRYVSQSNDSYTVKAESGNIYTIAKAYTQTVSTRRHYNFHNQWMLLAVFGLPLGGIPTVILSPIVFWKNVALLKNENLNAGELIHSKHLLIVSAISFLIALVFFALFIMHLIY